MTATILLDGAAASPRHARPVSRARHRHRLSGAEPRPRLGRRDEPLLRRRASVRAGRIEPHALRRAAARRPCRRFGVDRHRPRPRRRDLRLAERQVLEIIHALMAEPSVLILDEPTSALTAEQVDWFFARCASSSRATARAVHLAPAGGDRDALRPRDRAAATGVMSAAARSRRCPRSGSSSSCWRSAKSSGPLRGGRPELASAHERA